MAADTSREAVDDGGPAFPADAHAAHNDTAAGLLRPASQGMTLRDWFAGQALAGALAGSNMSAPLNMAPGETAAAALARAARETAVFAYAQADAMIALGKKGLGDDN